MFPAVHATYRIGATDAIVQYMHYPLIKGGDNSSVSQSEVAHFCWHARMSREHPF
jgi:hypothetical protein